MNPQNTDSHAGTVAAKEATATAPATTADDAGDEAQATPLTLPTATVTPAATATDAGASPATATVTPAATTADAPEATPLTPPTATVTPAATATDAGASTAAAAPIPASSPARDEAGIPAATTADAGASPATAASIPAATTADAPEATTLTPPTATVTPAASPARDETGTPAATDEGIANASESPADEKDDAASLGEQQKELFMRIVRENAALRAEQAEWAHRDRAAAQARGWQSEAEALKDIYPSLALTDELTAPQTGQRFQRLLMSGVDVRTAYEAVHRDEILTAVMRYAAERARDMTVADIRARGTRPAENGGDGTAAATLSRVNVHDLTRRERESIARRVLRGERVEL